MSTILTPIAFASNGLDAFLVTAEIDPATGNPYLFYRGKRTRADGPIMVPGGRLRGQLATGPEGTFPVEGDITFTLDGEAVVLGVNTSSYGGRGLVNTSFDLIEAVRLAGDGNSLDITWKD